MASKFPVGSRRNPEHKDATPSGEVAEKTEPRRVYVAEVECEVLVTTERMGGYKTVEETWREEVRLNRSVAGCEVEIYEDGGTPFDELMRERVMA